MYSKESAYSSIDKCSKIIPGVETSSPPKFGVVRMSDGPQNDRLSGRNLPQVTTTSTPGTVATKLMEKKLINVIFLSVKGKEEKPSQTFACVNNAFNKVYNMYLIFIKKTWILTLGLIT